MSHLRAGLVGLGVMGTHHARVLSALEGVELVGIVDPARAGETVAGQVVDNSLDALMSSGLDYCVVAAPTAAHVEVALQLAQRGIHALIEKPLALTTTECLEISSTFERAGLVGAVGHIERYNAAIREMRRRIADGQLGRVLQVATRRQGPYPARIADVGVVKDLATHDFDITMWVTGMRYKRVSACVTRQSGRVHEDMVTISGCLEDGAIVTHVVNWLSPFKERTVVVTGELGAFVADTLTGDLTYYENGVVESQWDDLAAFRGVSEGNVVRYAIPKPEPLLIEHREFARVVGGGQGIVVSPIAGANAVRVAEAVLESAASGHDAYVPPLA